MTATRQRNFPDRPADLLALAAKRLPLSAGSLIVTLIGDVVEPRGGAIGLSDLTRLLEPFGLNSGQIRTALSRLAADAWLARSRNGRHSTYRVAPARRGEFLRAMALVYHAHERRLDCIEQVVIVEADAGARAALRESLVARGFGQLAPAVLIRPVWAGDREHAAELPAGSAVRLEIETTSAGRTALATLGEIAWPLGEARTAYAEAIEVLRPIRRATTSTIEPAEAYQARVLAVHAFRRACLKDPQLPACLLPEDWPGFEALGLVAGIYRTTCKESERWLDAFGLETGAASRLEARFRASDMLHKRLR